MELNLIAIRRGCEYIARHTNILKANKCDDVDELILRVISYFNHETAARAIEYLVIVDLGPVKMKGYAVIRRDGRSAISTQPILG